MGSTDGAGFLERVFVSVIQSTNRGPGFRRRAVPF